MKILFHSFRFNPKDKGTLSKTGQKAIVDHTARTRLNNAWIYFPSWNVFALFIAYLFAGTNDQSVKLNTGEHRLRKQRPWRWPTIQAMTTKRGRAKMQTAQWIWWNDTINCLEVRRGEAHRYLGRAEFFWELWERWLVRAYLSEWAITPTHYLRLRTPPSIHFNNTLTVITGQCIRFVPRTFLLGAVKTMLYNHFHQR